jgi:hypothetical protein
LTASPNASNHKFNNIFSTNENGYHQQQLLVLTLLKFHGTLDVGGAEHHKTLVFVALNSNELNFSWC